MCRGTVGHLGGWPQHLPLFGLKFQNALIWFELSGSMYTIAWNKCWKFVMKISNGLEIIAVSNFHHKTAIWGHFWYAMCFYRLNTDISANMSMQPKKNLLLSPLYRVKNAWQMIWEWFQSSRIRIWVDFFLSYGIDSSLTRIAISFSTN